MTTNNNTTPTQDSPTRIVYAAYGSNLNIDQMSRRCPNAKPCGTGFIKDFRLVFRGVADIAKSPGEKAPVGFWEITDDCEKALDRYEGFPHLYTKVYFRNDQDDAIIMAYIMTDASSESMPSSSYYETIVDGYDDFQLDDAPLERALSSASEATAAEPVPDLFPVDALSGYAFESRTV